MTRRRLTIIVAIVSLALAIYALIGWNCVGNQYAYAFWKDLIPIVLALPVAILTSALQRRSSYLQALRELWKQLLPSIQSAIQYTHIAKPTQNDFAKVQVDLSIAIDSMRSVFRNVPVTGTLRGLYPYENVKDILMLISWLGFDNGTRTDNDRVRVRKCITKLWQEMYIAMLDEFDSDIPINPVSKYFFTGKSIADNLIDNTLSDECLKRPNNKPSKGKECQA